MYSKIGSNVLTIDMTIPDGAQVHSEKARTSRKARQELTRKRKVDGDRENGSMAFASEGICLMHYEHGQINT